MASAKFLEEALSTDVDESAVSAIVGSLETQLVTSTPPVSHPQQTTLVINQNHHINSAISNGASVPSQKHEGVANGESSALNVLHSDANKSINSPLQQSNTDRHTTPNSLQATYNISADAATTTQQTNQILSTSAKTNNNEGVKLVYPQGHGHGHGGTPAPGTLITNRVAFPAQTVPNGNIGLSPLTSHHTVLHTATSTVQSVQQQQQQININKQHHQQQQQIVIKSSGAPGLVSVPMNSSAPATANIQNIMTLAKPMTQTVVTSQQSLVQHQQQHQQTPQTILPGNVQILNVRPPGGQQPQKGVQNRVVLSAPQMVGARPGQPQITLQSLQGLQPGQQGHLLLKTENGQYQLLRVGPAPAAPGTAMPASTTQVAGAAGTTTYRLQTVPAVSRQFAGPPLTLRTKTIVQQPNSITPTNVNTNATPASSPAPVQMQQQSVSTVTAATSATLSTAQTTNSVPIQQRQNLDNTKEKCRKFLANLLELSSREPKSVERNVRTLIQELIDCKVEPEEFCDRLERLLNASPQPCLIGFLKKSLPLLRQSLVTKELTIDGIRPPPANVVYSIHSTTPTIQTTQHQQQQQQVRPQAQQMRIVAPAAGAVVRPGQVHAVQQRLVAPLRGQSPQPRMISAAQLRQQQGTQPVIVSTSQPPALHPVFPQTAQVRTTVNVLRPPLQVRTATAAAAQQQIRQATAIRTQTPLQVKSSAISSVKATLASKPQVPSTMLHTKQQTAKEKEIKTFSSAGYTGDDDINDVAAMGGVNLAEETQRILGSTEFVGTQIRSCKDEVFLHIAPLQQKIRSAAAKHGLDDPGADVAALISHAAQEYLKNIVEKLAVITDHRVDILKNDPRYEVTQDVKGQLKFLEELDRAERKRHEEQEREMLLRAAKSRSKSEDPEQAKLKAKAKEMQRVELEELRQREANATALQAIGPRKKQRLDGDSTAGSSQNSTGGAGGSGNRSGQLPLRQRMKKVTLRDLLFLMETEKDTCRSPLLYKSYLK